VALKTDGHRRRAPAHFVMEPLEDRAMFDDSPITAELLSGPNVTNAGSSSYTFIVRYTDVETFPTIKKPSQVASRCRRRYHNRAHASCTTAE